MSWHEPGRDRDPWRDPKDGPPDLDEWFHRAWQWVRDRFRRFSRPPGRRRFRFWWVVPVILIGIWLLTGFYRVDESQRVVLLRFGAYAGVSGPGLHWYWPWPIATRKGVNLGFDRSISEHARVFTRDSKLATMRLTVAYRISNPRAYFFGSRQPGDLISALAEAAIARAARERSLESLRADRNDKLAERLEKRIATGLAAAHAGISIESVRIGHIRVPAAVAGHRKQLADFMESHAKRSEKARSAAEEKLQAAREKASAIIARARKAAEARIERAHIRLAHFKALLPAWEKAPATTRKMLRADILFGTLAGLPKVVVSGSIHSVELPPVAASRTNPAASASRGEAGAAGARAAGGER